MVALAKYAKFYGIGGALCFLLSIEFTMLKSVGILIVSDYIPLFFGAFGCLIGIILLAIGRKSKESLNHGIVTLLLNIVAIVFILLIMYGIKIEI